MQPAASPSLSAWEMWLLNKTKEDRLKIEKKAEEASCFFTFKFLPFNIVNVITVTHLYRLCWMCFMTQERLLKEKHEQQERERKQKRIIVDEKIQVWLKVKREQVKKCLLQILGFSFTIF